MKSITSKTLLPAANIYIFLSIVFYWFETSMILNPVALGFVVVFFLHLFVAKGNAKLIFPSIFFVINLYMFLALFSEFGEFSTLNSEAIILLGVGILYLGINVLCSIVMILNYYNPTLVKL